jgi:predicted transcriptional regulator
VEYDASLKHYSNLKHDSKSVKANFEDTHEILAAERKRGTREDLQRGYRRVTPNYAATRSGLAKEVSPGRRPASAFGRPSAETAGTVRPGAKT